MSREGVNANQVYASGFPDSTSESDLYLFFGSYGEVTSVKLLINKKKNALIGAFITFRDCRCAEMVLEDQRRRQMYFKGAKIHVREAYKDKQQGGGGGGRGDFQRQTSGGSQHTGGDHRGFGLDRDSRQQSSYGTGGGYERGYSTGTADSSNKNPFLQSSIFSGSSGTSRSSVGGGMMSDNWSVSQYSSSSNIGSSGYGTDNRRDDNYNRRSDSYSHGYSGGRRSQGFDDSYSRATRGSYNRQDMSMDNSYGFDDANRSSSYQGDFNRSSQLEGSFTRGDSRRMQSGDSGGSWADIMDREDRFGDKRVDSRSYDRSHDAPMGGYSYSSDSGMAMRGDNYRDSYNRENRTSGNYDGNRSSSGLDGNRSATSGYDTQRSGLGGYESGRSSYDGYRTSERPVQSGDNYRSDRQMQSSGSYGESARYHNEPTDRGYREGGMSRSGNFGREQEVSSGMSRSGNYGRAHERYDHRDTRKRGSQWVGGYEEVPRKQMAMAGRDERPSNYGQREDSQNPFIQSLNKMDLRAVTVPNREDNLTRGPGATSTPRDSRGFESGRGAVDDRSRPEAGRDRGGRHEARSGFVGGPDRKDRPSGRGARGGARRDSPRGGVGNDPNTRQPINQGRQQMDRPSGLRPSDRRGWVGGGSMDASPNAMMGGNMSPQGGMNERFRGGMMQQQGMMPGGMPQSQFMQQQQQLQQMQMMKMRQQQQQQMAIQQQQQQRGTMMGMPVGGGGGMQGIMSTLAQLLQNLTKGRGGVQQRQMQINIMRELNPLERDVIAEVRRSLKVEETPLFAQAIMMMRPMDDEVITIFTQLPQGILMKILRGASPEEVTAELAKIPKTKSYDNRAEARFHVLRKLLIVLFKVSRDQGMGRHPIGPGLVRRLLKPQDLSRQRLLLAKRRLNLRGGFRGGFKDGMTTRRSTTSKTDAEKKDEKENDKKEATAKEGEKKEEEVKTEKQEEVSSRGRGGPRRGFGLRGRGTFRGRGSARGSIRGRGGFRGRGTFRGQGRGNGKPNGEVKKEEPKTTPVKKTTAAASVITAKKSATNSATKKTTATPAAKKAPVAKKTTPAAKKPTPAKTTTPGKTTPKTTPAKTTLNKTPVKK